MSERGGQGGEGVRHKYYMLTVINVDVCIIHLKLIKIAQIFLTAEKRVNENSSIIAETYY